jgi:hypothetical protein
MLLASTQDCVDRHFGDCSAPIPKIQKAGAHPCTQTQGMSMAVNPPLRSNPSSSDQ